MVAVLFWHQSIFTGAAKSGGAIPRR